ncbi:putative multidrug export ATP-binding/permease protein [Clostridium tepidiprofundi DSM 19306]|uniref:Putative multidrug export ATP-binding/permease protein n=1 Tax=Clostridium tepidiprofundi DSM 19306 TaxID=1121338 RepID=A0A151B464_9CLOT|nr:ABC transporter ATP-binding protein [Clostridium tepidiprofundi]KYH34695.1 putative multidrug export ATP-binding/permease protein [Clostridium tepidiprofundi DSM 19306]
MCNFLIKENKKLFILGIILQTFSTILEVGLAYVMMLCIQIAENQDLSKIGIYLLGFGGYIIVFFFIDFICRRTKWLLIKNAKISLRGKLLKNIFSLNTTQFHKKNTGDWFSLLSNDLDIVERSYFSSIFIIYTSILQFIISAIAILLISPYISIFVFIMVVIQLMIPKFFGPKQAQNKKKFSEKASEFTVNTTEELNAFDLIKGFHLEAQALATTNNSSKQLENQRFITKTWTSFINVLSYNLGSILYLGVFFGGALLVVSGHMDIATLIAASQLIVYISSPLTSLSNDLTELHSAKIVIKKLQKHLSNDVVIEEKCDYQEKVSFDYSLSLNNVSFKYEDNIVLKQVNYSFIKGKKYLLQGKSGVGKSTLIKLISKELVPNHGKILMDQVDIQKIKVEDYCRLVSINSQVPFIFQATIKENICLFQDTFSDKEIMDAVNFAGLGYVLARTELGINAMIGQSGINLSGGEKQRIALARIYLYKADIMILDESLSNLDNETANIILNKLLANDELTLLYISHQVDDNIRQKFDVQLEIQHKTICEI